MTFSSETLQKPLNLNISTPVHFVGIGGVGMSGLAKILLQAGFQVSGSDVSENAYTQELKTLGGTVFVGHSTENVPQNAILIVSTSIDPTNPEVNLALLQNLGIYHRSSLLREVLQGSLFAHRTTIGITGTHGKTSTTGMAGLALHAAGLDPTIVAGGKLPQLKTNAVLGQARQYAVAELDESDGTLIQYQPDLSVVANLELDHADHYTNGLDDVLNIFRQYLNALKPGSKVFYNVTCPNTRLLAKENPAHVEAILVAPGDVFTGSEPQTTYWLKNARNYGKGRYQAYVYRNQKMLGELVMSVPGRHNLANGLFALAVADQVGADFDEVAQSLKAFTGMGRRFETIGERKNALLVDDYAHHPSEVLATLKAAKETLHQSVAQQANTSITGGKQPTGRVISIFQPHRYTRLQALWDEFKTCFEDADYLFLADVYAAHEPEIPGITSAELAKQMNHPHVQALPIDNEFKTIRTALEQVIQPGDLVISMGAGNITHLLRDWNA